MAEIDDSYQAAILAGVRRAAARAQTNLLAYALGELPEAAETSKLATPELLDAVVLMSGAIGNRVTSTQLSDWCRSFAPLPTCSIAVPAARMSSVTIDNQAGMRRLVQHLIVDHGCRRIAFIAGPRDNPEARARLDAYWAALSAFDIELERELVVEGRFERSSGTAGVRALLDERGWTVRELDAIVAVDDSSALGALEELEARGIDVPGSLAVVGFDDVDEARFSLPTLTTVRQPLRELGERALEAALGDEDAAHGEQKLATTLVCRRSCGCYGPARRHRSDIPPHGTFSDLLEKGNRRNLLEVALRLAARGALWGLGSGWEVRLVDAVRARVVEGKSDAFIREWERVVRTVRECGAEMGACFDVLHFLRNEMSRHTAGGSTERSRLDAMLYEALAFTADVQRGIDADVRAAQARFSRLMATITAELSSSFDLVRTKQVLKDRLPILGIRSAHVATFDGSPEAAHLRTVFAFDTTGGEIQLDAKPYPAQKLVGAGFRSVLESRSHVVLPLHHGGHGLGIGVFELSDADGYSYLLVARLLAAVLAANVRR